VGRDTKLIHLNDLYIFHTHTHTCHNRFHFHLSFLVGLKKCDETTSASSTSQHHIKHTTGSF
jgi:hypothetical protein